VLEDFENMLEFHDLLERVGIAARTAARFFVGESEILETLPMAFANLAQRSVTARGEPDP